VRKRKTIYPVARTATSQRRAAGDAPYVRPSVVTIDMKAGAGRDDIAVGDRIQIGGSGLFAGEFGVVESTARGAIPSAQIQTDAGGRRRVRMVDLVRHEPRADAVS
jgi:hypothetical protein